MLVSICHILIVLVGGINSQKLNVKGGCVFVVTSGRWGGSAGFWKGDACGRSLPTGWCETWYGPDWRYRPNLCATAATAIEDGHCCSGSCSVCRHYQVKLSSEIVTSAVLYEILFSLQETYTVRSISFRTDFFFK